MIGAAHAQQVSHDAYLRQAVRTDATSDGAAVELGVHVPGRSAIGEMEFRKLNTNFGAIL
jgi:hypothetical protein